VYVIMYAYAEFREYLERGDSNLMPETMNNIDTNKELKSVHVSPITIMRFTRNTICASLGITQNFPRIDLYAIV